MVEDKPKNPDTEELSKNAAKKAERKRLKAIRPSANKSNTPQTQQESILEDDVSKDKYGNLPLIRSESNPPKREFINVTELNKELVGKVKWIRARLHAVRGKGKQCFAVLRQQEATVQAFVCVGDEVSKQMIKFASG